MLQSGFGQTFPCWIVKYPRLASVIRGESEDNTVSMRTNSKSRVFAAFIGFALAVAMDLAVNTALAATSQPAGESAVTRPSNAAQDEHLCFHIANDAFIALSQADEYLNEVDINTRRTPDSAPAGHIKSLIPNIPRDGDYTNLAAITAARYYTAPVQKICGKRVRVSAWIKTQDVREAADLDLYGYGADGTLLIADNTMDVAPIHGTTDWTQYQIVEDIPPDTTRIAAGASVFCTGELWVDDLKVEVVGNDVPLSDIQEWRIFSPVANRYTAATDDTVQHDGRPVICLQSDPHGHGWMQYNHAEFQPDPKFLGHRIRFTIWIKSSGVSTNSGPHINTFGPWARPLTNEGQRYHRPIMGTHDWKQYSAVADVPAETKTIIWGVVLNGRGKLWIDVDSAQVELADNDNSAPAQPKTDHGF